MDGWDGAASQQVSLKNPPNLANPRWRKGPIYLPGKNITFTLRTVYFIIFYKRNTSKFYRGLGEEWFARILAVFILWASRAVYCAIFKNQRACSEPVARRLVSPTIHHLCLKMAEKCKEELYLYSGNARPI